MKAATIGALLLAGAASMVPADARDSTVSSWPVLPARPSAPAADEARIREIVNGMTLEQKIGQMTQPDIRSVTPDDVRAYYIGSVLNGGGAWPGNKQRASVAEWLKLSDEFYRASMATDMKVKVPVVWGVDAVHGHNNIFGATLFPHNIGLGAARDADLVRRIGRATAEQVRATGITWTFAPTLAETDAPAGILCPLPLFHIYGLTVDMNYGVLTGATAAAFCTISR